MSRAPILALVVLAGCASTSADDRKALLEGPIDCATAQADLAALEAAMPSRRERARSVVQSVTPVGAVSGVVTGSYDERLGVLSGATEDELEARIDAITSECGTAEAGTEQEKTS